MASLKEKKALAKEMNEVMGLDPKIKFTAVKEEELTEDIINNAIGMDEDGEVDPEDALTEKDKLSPESWATLGEILDPEDEDHTDVLAIAKKKGKKASGGDKKAAKPKKEKAPKEPRFTRATAFKQIMVDNEDGLTKDELDAEMIKIYGGSEKEAAFQNYNFLRLMVEFGFIKENDDKKYVLVQKPKK